MLEVKASVVKQIWANDDDVKQIWVNDDDRDRTNLFRSQIDVYLRRTLEEIDRAITFLQEFTDE